MTTDKKSMEVNVELGAVEDVERLTRDLDLTPPQLLGLAVLLLRDAVDAGVVTRELAAQVWKERQIDYSRSWLSAFRLYNVITSVAPEQSLQQINRIFVEGRGPFGPRHGIDWAQDFEQLSQDEWQVS